MVRIHQDGYPYINLSFFVVVENNQKHQLFGKIDWSMNSRPLLAGGCYGYQKKIFPFSKLDKKWYQCSDNLKS